MTDPETPLPRARGRRPAQGDPVVDRRWPPWLRAAGYTPTFGLVAVDRSTFVRTPNPSLQPPTLDQSTPTDQESS